jgi:UTP:GlnB (protein PII) uridylyltransferase
MKKIDITRVTATSLKKGLYRSSFPEYYRLENFVENNAWHSQQNCLDHVIAVYSALEKILNSGLVTRHHDYLNQKIGNHSRLNLLKIATLFHDISKQIVLIKNSDGTTACPSHEIISCYLINDFNERFSLNQEDKKYVERIVLYHGFVSEIITLIINGKNEHEILKIFKDIVGDISIELFIFIYADLSGSDLEKVNSQQFIIREKQILKYINIG